jgi:WD40 repeat protein
MEIHLAGYNRRMARWSMGLLLLAVGLFTIALFFTTGRPVRRDFIPVDQLGFTLSRIGGLQGASGKPGFYSISSSGRCFITTAPLLVDADQELIATIFDTATLQKVGSFPSRLNTLRNFELSPDRQFLIAAKDTGLHVWHLESGKEEVAQIEMLWRDHPRNDSSLFAATAFAPGSRQLLIYTDKRVVHYDLSEYRILGAFQAPAQRNIRACFFDSRGRPKALMFRLLKELEVWDVTSNQMDATLDLSEIKSRGFVTGEYDSSFEVGAGDSILASAYHDPCFIFIRSLETGRSLQNYSLPFKWCHPLRFSPDGRFLIIRYPLKYPLVSVAEGLHKGIEKWLEGRFPLQQRLALIDLHSGEIWPGLIGNGLCAFTDDGARLISFTDEGRYEYDVPPRWQYFTPWAWAPLGAWAGLTIVWWKLRERRPD